MERALKMTSIERHSQGGRRGGGRSALWAQLRQRRGWWGQVVVPPVAPSPPPPLGGRFSSVSSELLFPRVLGGGLLDHGTRLHGFVDWLRGCGGSSACMGGLADEAHDLSLDQVIRTLGWQGSSLKDIAPGCKLPLHLPHQLQNARCANPWIQTQVHICKAIHINSRSAPAPCVEDNSKIKSDSILICIFFYGGVIIQRRLRFCWYDVVVPDRLPNIQPKAALRRSSWFSSSICFFILSILLFCLSDTSSLLSTSRWRSWTSTSNSCRTTATTASEQLCRCWVPYSGFATWSISTGFDETNLLGTHFP